MINSILPGVYIETMAGKRTQNLNTIGVVTMPLELDWGDKVITLNKGENPLVKLGYRMSDIKLKLVNEVMNYAEQLILYRLNSGTQAGAQAGTSAQFKAVYAGARGNDIKVIVTDNEGIFTVKTFIKTEEIDKQIVASAESFKTNAFLSITGTGALTAQAISLTGGENGSVTTGALDEYFVEIQKHRYNVMAYPYEAQENIAKVIDFIEVQRSEGTSVTAVISGIAADNKAIVNNSIGGKTANYELTKYEACATLAGIQAKCGIQASGTYYDVIGWLDVNPRLTIIEMETKTIAGETLFVLRYGKAILLYDINSLTTYTETDPKDFSKNLIVRSLDMYANELQILLDTRAIGKIRNSVDGRNQIKGFISDMTVKNYLDKGYIEGFIADDITVSAATERDSIIVTVGIKFVDTVDKIYITVTAL